MSKIDDTRRALLAVVAPGDSISRRGRTTMALADAYATEKALAARADVERIFRDELDRRLAQVRFPSSERDLEPWVAAFNRCQREGEALEAALRERMGGEK